MVRIDSSKPDLQGLVKDGRIDELKEVVNSRAADVNGKDEVGFTALHRAIERGRVDIAIFLLDWADLTAQDRDGLTPLHVAVEYKIIDVAEGIVARNPAAVHISDKHGNQPLWRAVFKAGDDDLRFVELLLEAGADPHHVNRVGRSPDWLAHQLNRVAVQALFARRQG